MVTSCPHDKQCPRNVFLLQSERDSGTYILSATSRLANPAQDTVFVAVCDMFSVADTCNVTCVITLARHCTMPISCVTSTFSWYQLIQYRPLQNFHFTRLSSRQRNFPKQIIFINLCVNHTAKFSTMGRKECVKYALIQEWTITLNYPTKRKGFCIGSIYLLVLHSNMLHFHRHIHKSVQKRQHSISMLWCCRKVYISSVSTWHCDSIHGRFKGLFFSKVSWPSLDPPSLLFSV
jgi:hypothetical protein